MGNVVLQSLLPPNWTRIHIGAHDHIPAPIGHPWPVDSRQHAACSTFLIHVGRQPNVGGFVFPRTQPLVLNQKLCGIHTEVHYCGCTGRKRPISCGRLRWALFIPRHQARLGLICEVLCIFQVAAFQPTKKEAMFGGSLIVNPIIPGTIRHVVGHSGGQVVIQRLLPWISWIIVWQRHALRVEVIHRVLEPLSG